MTKDHVEGNTFMKSTRKGVRRAVLKIFTYLRIPLFLNNISIFHFCGYGQGEGIHKFANFFWAS